MKIQFEANSRFTQTLYWAPRCNEMFSNTVWGILLVASCLSIRPLPSKGRLSSLSRTQQGYDRKNRKALGNIFNEVDSLHTRVC